MVQADRLGLISLFQLVACTTRTHVLKSDENHRPFQPKPLLNCRFWTYFRWFCLQLRFTWTEFHIWTHGVKWWGEAQLIAAATFRLANKCHYLKGTYNLNATLTPSILQAPVRVLIRAKYHLKERSKGETWRLTWVSLNKQPSFANAKASEKTRFKLVERSVCYGMRNSRFSSEL